MILKMWKEEFTKSAFAFQYDYPERFTRCHWQNAERVLPAWIAYRAIMAAYFFFSLLYTVTPLEGEVPEEKRIKYLIFLTHWTYLLEVLVFFWGLGIVSARAWKENRQSVPLEPYKKMPWTYIVYWILYTIVLSGSVAVSVIFWAGVYDPKYFPVNATNLIEHAFNSLIMVVDFCLVGHPIRFLHIYLAPVYGAIYTIFTVIYYLCGGTGVKGFHPIYKILDWRQPDAACLTCLFAMIFLVVLHTIFFLVSKFKIWMKNKSQKE